MKNTQTQNGMVITFEEHQKRVQTAIDSIIRDASNPFLSLAALYNTIADDGFDWPFKEESLRLTMNAIDTLN